MEPFSAFPAPQGSMALQAIPLSHLKHSVANDVQWRYALNRLRANLKHYRCCVLELSNPEQVAVLQYAKQMLAAYGEEAPQKPQQGQEQDPASHKQVASIHMVQGAKTCLGDCIYQTLEYRPGLRQPHEQQQLSSDVYAAAQAACQLFDKVGRTVLKLLSYSQASNMYSLHQLLDNVPNANYQSSGRLDCVRMQPLPLEADKSLVQSSWLMNHRVSELLVVVSGDQPEMKVLAFDGHWEPLQLKQNQVAVLPGHCLEYATGASFTGGSYMMGWGGQRRLHSLAPPSGLVYRLTSRPDAVLDAESLFKVPTHRLLARLREPKAVQQVVREFEESLAKGRETHMQPISIKLDGARSPPRRRVVAVGSAGRQRQSSSEAVAAAAAAAAAEELSDAGAGRKRGEATAAAAARKRRKTADAEIALAGRKAAQQRQQQQQQQQAGRRRHSDPAGRQQRGLSRDARGSRGRRASAAGACAEDDGGDDGCNARDQSPEEESGNSDGCDRKSDELSLVFREHPTGDEVLVVLKLTTRLSQACAAYSRAKGLHVNELRFQYQQRRLDSTGVLNTQTAGSLGMQDQGVVDVFHA